MEEKWIIIAWTCDDDIAVLIDEDGNSRTFDSEGEAIDYASNELTAEWTVVGIN